MAHYSHYVTDRKTDPRMGREAKSGSCGVVSPEKAYPERDGWGRMLERRGGALHIGYTHVEAKACPCGNYPVFEQYFNDRDPARDEKNVPAEVFVAICPACELRAEGEGTLEEMLAAWNERRFSEDSLMVSREISFAQPEAMAALCGIVCMTQIEEAVNLIRRKHKIRKALKTQFGNEFVRGEQVSEIRRINAQLTLIERFLRNSPLMYERDPDAVISDIRKTIHPGNSREEIEQRLKIPLKLTAI